jgi:hypothetical protein
VNKTEERKMNNTSKAILLVALLSCMIGIGQSWSLWPLPESVNAGGNGKFSFQLFKIILSD